MTRRKFGEVHDGVEQRLVFAPARAGNGAGGGVESLANRVLALGGGGGDEVLRKRVGVVRGLVDFDRAAGKNAMASLVLPALMPPNSTRNDLAVEQRDHPAHRTHEALGGLPRQYMFLAQ